MNIVIDACSLINLENADSLHVAAHLQRCRLWISPMVVGECGAACVAQILALQAEGAFQRIDEESMPASRFLDLLDIHGLGAGETECIVAAESHGYAVCSDDRQARDLAMEILGDGRVIGSARLLKWCVEDAILICEDAAERFKVMRAAGGFLPHLEDGFFVRRAVRTKLAEGLMPDMCALPVTAHTRHRDFVAAEQFAV